MADQHCSLSPRIGICEQAKVSGAAEPDDALARRLRHGKNPTDKHGREVCPAHHQLDPTGMASANLGAVGIPTTLLLDRQGREIGRLVGEAEWDTPEMINFLAETIETTQEDAP